MIYRSCYTRTHAEKGTDVETEITPKGILLCADGISRELRSTAHLLRDGVRCAPFRLRHLLALVHASTKVAIFTTKTPSNLIHRYHFRSHSKGHQKLVFGSWAYHAKNSSWYTLHNSSSPNMVQSTTHVVGSVGWL